jgi:hypothetical protein
MQSSGFSAPNRLRFQRSRKKNLYNLWAPPTFATLLLREGDKKTTTNAAQLVKSKKQLATTTASLLACILFQLAITASGNVRHRSLSMPRIVARCCSNCEICLTKPACPPARLLRAESWHNRRQPELHHDTVTARPSMRSRGFRRLPRYRDLGDRKQPVLLPVRLPTI